MEESGTTSCQCKSFHKFQLVFISQVIAILIVILASVINLSIGNSDKTIWQTLLASCLGFLLPSPSLKKNRRKRIS